MSVRSVDIIPKGIIRPSSPEDIIDYAWNFFRYWRSMPVPLIPKDIAIKLISAIRKFIHFGTFIKYYARIEFYEKTVEEQLMALKDIISLLSKAQFMVLKAVLIHLSRCNIAIIPIQILIHVFLEFVCLCKKVIRRFL